MTNATNSSSATSVRFTEEMKGHVTLGATEFADGRDQGKADGTFCMFHLTIQIPDIDVFLTDPQRTGTCQGWVGCDALGGKLPLVSGVFNLFVDDADEPGRKWMRYRLWFHDGAGHPLTLVGFKNVYDDRGFDVWSDTSTLYTRILAGHVEAEADAAARVVASGILNIWIRDFAKQMTTFRSHGPTWRDRFRAMRIFGTTFASQLKQVYLCRRGQDSSTAPGSQT